MIVSSLSDRPWESVSHNHEIKKQVLIRNGELGPITQLAQSVFKPGQLAPVHAHADMGEVFLVISGTLTILVDGETSEHAAGTCLSLHPGEHHELSNHSEEDVVVITLGVRMNPED